MTQLDRVEQMLQGLCKHLGVQVPQFEAPTEIGKASTDGIRYTGVVSRFEHGWGFVKCPQFERPLFVHHTDSEGEQPLSVGDRVTFEIGPGKDDRPKAVRVRVVSDAENPEDVAGVSSHTGIGDPDDPNHSDDTAALEDDPPQPASSTARPLRPAPVRRSFGLLARLSPNRRPPTSW